MADQIDPSLTPEEEQALDEYERLEWMASECLESPGVQRERDDARATAVRRIRAAERERTLKEVQTTLNDVADFGSKAGYWMASPCEVMYRIATLRGTEG